MNIKEQISIEDFDGIKFKIKVVEAENEQRASFTHYLHNHKNGVSKFFKPDAINYIKEILTYKFPSEKITNNVAEEALQYFLFDLKNSVPFSEPQEEKFKFIDLFAGII